MTLGDILINVRSDTSQLVKGFNRAETTVQKATKNMTRAVKTFAAAYISLGAIDLARKFGEQADAMTNVNSKLKLVTASTSELKYTQQKLFDISKKTRSNLLNNVDLYQKISFSTKELNLTQKEQLSLTEQINKELLISGTTSAGAATLITQLGQAFSSNFQAVSQEINTLKDQAPSLYQTILAGTGKTAAEFKKMAEAGELSSKMIIDAIAKQASATDKNFSMIATTMNKAYVNVETSTSVIIGKFDELTGASKYVSDSIIGISESIDELDPEKIIEVSKQIGIVAGSIGGAVVAIKTYNTAVAISATATALFGGALGGVNIAIVATTIATKALSLAMKTIPFIAVTAGLATVANMLLTASENAKTMEDAIETGGKSLDKLTKKQLELTKAITQQALVQKSLEYSQARADVGSDGFFESDAEKLADIEKKNRLRKEFNDLKKLSLNISEAIVNSDKKEVEITKEALNASSAANSVIKDREISQKSLNNLTEAGYEFYLKNIKIEKEHLKLLQDQKDAILGITGTDYEKYLADINKEVARLSELEVPKYVIDFYIENSELQYLEEEMKKWEDGLDVEIDIKTGLFDSWTESASQSLADAVVQGLQSGDVKGAIQGLMGGISSSLIQTSVNSMISAGSLSMAGVGGVAGGIAMNYISQQMNAPSQREQAEARAAKVMSDMAKSVQNVTKVFDSLGKSGSSLRAELMTVKATLDGITSFKDWKTYNEVSAEFMSVLGNAINTNIDVSGQSDAWLASMSAGVDRGLYEKQLEKISELYKEKSTLDANEFLGTDQNIYYAYQERIKEINNELYSIFTDVNFSGSTDLSNVLAEIDERAKSSSLNIQTWQDSFKSQTELLQGSGFGVADSIETLNDLFIKLSESGGILTDEELEHLNANKQLIESQKALSASAADMYEQLTGTTHSTTQAYLDLSGTFVDSFGGLQTVLDKVANNTLDMTSAQWEMVQAVFGLQDTSTATATNTARIETNTRTTAGYESFMNEYLAKTVAQKVFDVYDKKYGGVEDIKAFAGIYDVISGAASKFPQYTAPHASYGRELSTLSSAFGIEDIYSAQSGNTYAGYIEQLQKMFEDLTGLDYSADILKYANALDTLGTSAETATSSIDQFSTSILDSVVSIMDSIIGNIDNYVTQAFANNISYAGTQYRQYMQEVYKYQDIFASGQYTQQDLEKLQESVTGATSFGSQYYAQQKYGQSFMDYDTQKKISANQLRAVQSTLAPERNYIKEQLDVLQNLKQENSDGLKTIANEVVNLKKEISDLKYEIKAV